VKTANWIIIPAPFAMFVEGQKEVKAASRPFLFPQTDCRYWKYGTLPLPFPGKKV
jgi:hypothetical protein